MFGAEDVLLKKPAAAVTGFLWRPEISCQSERLGKYHSFLLSTLSGSFSEIVLLNKRVRPDGPLGAFPVLTSSDSTALMKVTLNFAICLCPGLLGF